MVGRRALHHALRPALHAAVLGAFLLGACTPQEALTPKLTSDVIPTPTPQPRAAQSPGSAQMTAEQGLAVVMEAWSRLLEVYVEPADPLDLLRAAWDGFSAALPAGQARPPFPALSGTNPQADLLRFRTAYLTAASQAGGGVEGQAVLANAGIRKMTESLADCLTSFTDAGQVEEQLARQQSETRTGGVGIRIKRKASEPAVIWELLEGGSAGKAGIKPGDAIVKVDGKDIGTLTLDQIATSIRGPEGSSVKLTVERADGKRTQDFSLKRAPLNEPAFQTRMLKGDVAYFRLIGFGQPVQTQLLASIRDYEAKRAKGWIFDLRTNASSDYAAMQATLSTVLKDGPFGYDQDRQGRRSALGPAGAYLPRQRPYVVLVSDSTSASAELFAAAVEHHKSGTVIGNKTAGCSGSASRFQLSDGSVLSVASRRVIGPGDLELNRKGLSPRETVEVTRAELASGKDPQLDRALAVLGVR